METIINGLKINYLVLGEGRPFLILHGWGSSAERWDKVIKFLVEGGIKVIIPDLPGFGKSDLPPNAWNLNNYCSFVEDFVLNIPELSGDFYLLGHSFGGALAAKFAIKHPQKVRKLFLVSAACIRKKTVKKWYLARISKIFKIFSFLPFYDLARRAFYKFIVGKSDYLQVNGVMKEAFLKVVSEDLSQHLSFVKVPTVIIWGEKDNTTLLEDAYFINKKIENSKLVLIPGVGHDLNQKAPEVLSQEILKFTQFHPVK